MKTKTKPTLGDVARAAGVSQTTASYILNDRAEQMRIAADTEERVRRAAAELRYRPNPSARSLRLASTRTIGLVSDLVAGGQFASQMLVGATTAARELDHIVVIGESQGDPKLERLLIEELLDRHVDGIVWATVVTSYVTLPKALRGQRVVLLNCLDRNQQLPAVVPDEYEGGRTAARLVLAGEGRGRVHVVGERPTGGAFGAWLRRDGIRDELRSAGVRPGTPIPCAWAVQPAFEAVDAFLRGGARPATLICLNDRIAMGTYQALAEHGLTVPDDVSVVSFDGSELATWLRPEATSVTLPYAQLGARAVELLLNPEPAGPEVTRLPMPVSTGASLWGATRGGAGV